jgi:hypothetical protein
VNSYRHPLIVLALVPLFSFAGCEMLGGGGGDGGRDPLGPIPLPEEQVGERGDVPPDGAIEVPRTSEIAREGRGGLSYQADRDGMLYLYDVDDKRVIDRKTIRSGERYTFDPKRNIATIDGRIVTERRINQRHEHRIYFDPEGAGRLTGDEPISGGGPVRGDERISRPIPDREPEKAIPDAAVRVADGRDELSYRADRDGTIYVRDASEGRVIYSGHLHAKERFVLDPRRQRITIDGRVVQERGVRDGSEYRVYFRPD